MADGVRERLLEATYRCISRYGLAKTTVEDAARQAGVSRATVYRYFPGGRDELVRETIRWETASFFARLAEAVADAETFAEVLERALPHARRAVLEHAVLQKLLETEPDRLLPTLTVEANGLLPVVAAFVRPYLDGERLRPGIEPAEAAEHVARLVLSLIASPGRWDLDEPGQVAELVRDELLGGIVDRS